MSTAIATALIGAASLIVVALISGGFALVLQRMARLAAVQAALAAQQNSQLEVIHDLVNNTHDQAIKEIHRIGRLRVLDQIAALPGPTNPKVTAEIGMLEKLGP
jgi:hypothetical protein